MRAGAIIAEPLVINQRLSKQRIQERLQQLLSDVGLEPARLPITPMSLAVASGSALLWRGPWP